MSKKNGKGTLSARSTVKRDRKVSQSFVRGSSVGEPALSQDALDWTEGRVTSDDYFRRALEAAGTRAKARVSNRVAERASA